MKKIGAILLAGCLAFGLVACSSNSNTSAPAAASSAASEAASEAAAAASEAASEAAEAVSEAASEAEAEGGYADKVVGICIYQFSDNFMTLYRNEMQSYLESLGFAPENIKIVDGANDQATQTTQIQNFITEGVDVLVINPVNSSSAETITDMVVDAGIPLVYINREPSEDEEARWEAEGMDVTYVGCDARQSGTMQGEIIGDLGLDSVDLNGNGKIDYIMIKGDPENVDAQFRTEFSIKALEDGGFEVNKLDEQTGMWQQEQGQTLVANALAAHGEEIEVVFCNNDAMALGAKQAIDAAGRTVGEDIFLVGVDALTEACEFVLSGEMTGTVFNDHISQAHSACDAAVNFVDGRGNDYYIGCDYVKVTADNAQEILDSLK